MAITSDFVYGPSHRYLHCGPPIALVWLGVKLTDSACRLRTVTKAALTVMAVLFCVCIFLIVRVTDQEKQIHALRGDLDAIHDILDAGVVVEEWTATETTTTQTVDGDSATINNVDGEQYNDNAVKVLLDTARR